MAEKCVVCHDRPMKFRCMQCHKTVCEQCAFRIEEGAFCSRECSDAYSDRRHAEPAGASRRGGGLRSVVKLLIGLIVLAVLAAALARAVGWIDLPWLPGP